jgi:diguanylate cyclase (GGDEF)-like protein
MQVFARNGFARKMTLMAMLASGLGSTCLILALLGYDTVSAREQLNRRLETLATIVGQNSAASLLFHDPGAATEVLSAMEAERSVAAACLYDRTGALFAEFRRAETVKHCSAQAGKQSQPLADDVTVSRTIEQQGAVAGTLRLEADTAEIPRRRVHMLRISGGLLLLAMVVSAIAGSLLQERISKPLRDLASAMRQVTDEQNFATRVSSSGANEITQLSDNFNVMLTELERRAAEKAKFEERLHHQAHNDELTGLPNRRLLADRLARGVEAARRRQNQIALLYIDLDGFKRVNDTLGHAVGDLLLREVAQRFQARTRSADTVARLGGDEFSVVLADIKNPEQASAVALDLLARIAPAFNIAGHEIMIGASIGIALSSASGSDPQEMLLQADSAMYDAKRSGKNCVRFFSESLGYSLREHVDLENQLRHALAGGQICVHFQPKFGAASGRLSGFEALARWNHPEMGWVSPARFIPVAEECGLIVPLGMTVLEQACREAAQWREITGHRVPVAVNVSSVQLRDETLVGAVADVLRRTGLDPASLQLELTESIMLDRAGAADVLQGLAAMGVELAIDDFGTGYSSLSCLRELPFKALKIDMSFTKGLEARDGTEAVVRSIVALGRNLDMRVIAEGVETEAQMSSLVAMGCDELQGYLLGRPTNEPRGYLEMGGESCALPSLPGTEPDGREWRADAEFVAVSSDDLPR